jgi:hypothetical protein
MAAVGGAVQDGEDEGSDGNTDGCVLCGAGGSLLCCDGCPAAYHLRCISESSRTIPEGEWLCPECRFGGRGEGGGALLSPAGACCPPCCCQCCIPQLRAALCCKQLQQPA